MKYVFDVDINFYIYSQYEQSSSAQATTATHQHP